MATADYSFYDLKTVQFISSIPLIQEPITAVDAVLSSNPVFGLPYLLAKSASHTTIRSADSVAQHFAPYINQADELVNAGLTQVADKVPFAFESRPEDIATLLRDRSKAVQDLATETVAASIFKPALVFAAQLDATAAPAVDLFEKTLAPGPLHAAPPVPSDAQFLQSSRILALSQGILNYSFELFNQIQENNVLLHTAVKAVQSFIAYVTVSVNFANARAVDVRAKLQALSDNMILQLNNAQLSIMNLVELFRERAQAIPGSKALIDLYTETLETTERLRDIALEDSTWLEKAGRLNEEAQEKWKPAVAQLQAFVPALVRA